MSEAKHTPGPWAQRDTDGYNDTEIVGANGTVVALVRDGDFDGPLVRAAPDMLAALQWIVDRDRSYVLPSGSLDPSRIIEHEPGRNVLYMGAYAVRARAAIRPLKGGPPSPAQQDVLGAACRYAESLAVALVKRHWADETHGWKPLSGDLIGLLTQIDNMTSGLTRQPAQGVPEGWKLVPVEITEDMAVAMECEFSTEGQWRAALAAAPAPLTAE